MKNEEDKNAKYRKAANISSIVMVPFLSAVFILEAWWRGTEYNTSLVGFFMLLVLIIVISTIKNSPDFSLLALNIPFVLFLFYTVLTGIGGWSSSQYFLVCFIICGISCIYSNFNRTIG
ncbi:MAG: hypothetical protein LBH43_19560, partial [Treponema sp.]|nr:hypothetical protein [Treponema sp.]